MGKKLFSINPRGETILAYLKESGTNLSGFTSDAILDEVLPVYSELRVSAIYLLDYVTDGAKDWTGNKLVDLTGRDELETKVNRALGEGIVWLRRNHHIKNGDILRDIISNYQTGPWTGGVELDDTNDNVKGDVTKMRETLNSIDPSYNDFHVGLGSLARDVLDHWEQLWDMDLAYEILIDTVFCEKPIDKISPFFAIKALQTIENQAIIELLKEKK